MKLGIPTQGEKGLDEFVGNHFGRVPTYTIIDLDTENVKVVPNTSHHMGGEGNPPEILSEAGVDVMICQNLGRRAINLFEQLGIQVYIGASGKVRDAVKAFKQGDLQQAGMNNACEEHAFRGKHRH